MVGEERWQRPAEPPVLKAESEGTKGNAGVEEQIIKMVLAA